MSDNYDRILGGLGVTTTTTPATVAHACALAGGIRVSLDPAVFGWTLTIADELRALTLTLVPEQVAEMATWGADLGTPPYLPGELPCSWLAWDVQDFARTTRLRLSWRWGDIDETVGEDYAALRALARAALGEGER